MEAKRIGETDVIGKYKQESKVEGGSYKVGMERRKMDFQERFREILWPRDQSDRTTLQRLSKWLGDKCLAGDFDETVIFEAVINWARETKAGYKRKEIRNPWAVLMSILKKELGYRP